MSHQNLGDHIDIYRILRIQEIIKELCLLEKSNNDIKILDIGCGEGLLLKPFSKNHDCYGVDVVKRLIEKAEKNGIKGTILNIDTSYLPYDNNFFDIIIMAQVIEHIINTDHILREINRVLKNYKHFIISFPNINQPASLFIMLILDYPPIFSARYKSTHVRDFTLRIMKKALKNNGFTIKSVEGTTIFPFNNRFTNLLSKRFPRFSERIIIRAKKNRLPVQLPSVVDDIRKI